MIKPRLPRFCTFDPDPRGNERYYVRKKGSPKIRIRAPLEDGSGEISKAFMEEYWAALATIAGAAPAAKKEPPREETFNWLCDQYFRSDKYKRFDPATQRDKRSVLNRFCETAGNLPYRKYRSEDMQASQLKRKQTPGAADKLVKVLRALFNWAMTQKPPLASANPAVGIDKLNVATDGFHTWTAEEVDQFRAFHPIGTKPRLAMEIMINVGARISDAAQLGCANVTQHEGKPWLRFTAFKNRNRFPSVIDVPMTADLIEALAKSKAGDRAYLETGYGKPYVVKGLGNKMREWCDAAGLPHCSAHGLRKAAAVKMAESNVSAPELCAVFGWKNLSTAQVYIKKAENRRMAGNAFTRQHDYENSKSVSLLKPENSDETKDGNSDE